MYCGTELWFTVMDSVTFKHDLQLCCQDKGRTTPLFFQTSHENKRLQNAHFEPIALLFCFQPKGKQLKPSHQWDINDLQEITRLIPLSCFQCTLKKCSLEKAKVTNELQIYIPPKRGALSLLYLITNQA